MNNDTVTIPKITLDSNCIIDAVQRQGAWQHVERLVELARGGHVQLWITDAFDAEQIRARDEHREANLRWLADRPLIGRTVPVMRLDYPTAILGVAVLASDEGADADRTIQDIILPQELRPGHVDPGDTKATKRQAKRIHDVHHLSAHWTAEHDFFVTRDEDDMLKKREELKRRVGIVVLTPAEVLEKLSVQ
ncbi:hypothetical protein [Nonomuraea helvata]|uniref:PIN domain-containing protein n=1 Tax=Nonomuraea helvata TaxID=37484 RepID=A0ABV5RT13_9ACTN